MIEIFIFLCGVAVGVVLLGWWLNRQTGLYW
jgi:hypothetical protein